MPISTSQSLFVFLCFTLSTRVTECPYQRPSHLFVSLRFTLNPQVTECPYNFQVIVLLSTFYSQSTSHWMPISTSQSLFVSLRFSLSQQVTECPYQLPSHCSSLSVFLSVHKSLNAHINFPVIVRLSPFFSQSTSHWMPISSSQSLFVFLCFTLSTRVTECPYQLPSHLSSLYVLLWIHKSLNVHTTSRSLFFSLRFTLNPQVTECPYQLPSHCSSLYVLLSVHKSLNAHINFPVIIRLSTFYSQSTSHWMPISTSQSLFVSLRFTLSPQVTEYPYQLPTHCSFLYDLLSVHKSLNTHINFPLIVRLSTFYSQSTSHWMPISTSQSLFVSLHFTLSPQVTEYPYQLPTHCSFLYDLLSVHKSLNTHINFPLIVRLSTFYSQSTSHWMPISTSQSLFVSLHFTLSPQVTEYPYQLPSHLKSLYVLLSVNKSLNAHINFQVIVRLSPFYSQSTSHWMPISTSQSLFVFLCFTLSTRVTECPYQLPSHFSCLYVLLWIHKSLNVHTTSRSLFFSLRFTLNPQVTEYPYQLPSHCSSLSVLLAVHELLNAHINFPVIFRLSPFYSQSTSHWMPISTSQSLFVFLRFTLSPPVTECPYQPSSHFRLSTFYSQSTSHWMPISTSNSLFVSLRFTLSPRVTECPYQLPSHCSSLSVLLSVHNSLNAHINFQVIVRLSTFYALSTSHWMPISTSQSLFVSLRFTLSPQVTECPYQPPGHCSSLYVLLSVHKSLNVHINFPVMFVSTFYSQSTSHWMPISTSKSLFVSLRFTLSPQVTEYPYQLPTHCSSLYVLLSVHKSLNTHTKFPVIYRLSTFYSQSRSHWMAISTSQSLFVFLCFTLSTWVTECPYKLPSHFSSLYVLFWIHKSLNVQINLQVIVLLSTFYSQSTSHWMPISTSQSLFVSLRFTLSPQVTECPYQLPVIVRLSTFYSQSTSNWMPISTSQSLFVSLHFSRSPQFTECPYQLPSHCSSFSVLLSVRESLNAHTSFPVIFRLSTFYSQSTTHWMPIPTSQSLFVSLRFNLSPQVTECPYQLPGHCSSLYVLLSVNKLLNAHINFPVIIRLYTFYSQSKSHWIPISTSHSFFVCLRLLSVHKSLNADINFPVIVRLSTFYSHSTSHLMPISTSQSLFVSLRFTLSPQVTEWMPISTSQSLFVSLLFSLSPQVTKYPYQLPSHCSSLYVLLSVHKSLNTHTKFPVIHRRSTFYSQSRSHWMPISTSRLLFVFLCFSLSTWVTECPYQLPFHCSFLYVLLWIHKSLNVQINLQVIVLLSTFYSQSTSHWMPIPAFQSFFVSLRFTLSPRVTECP